MSNWELKEKSTGELITTVEGGSLENSTEKSIQQTCKKSKLTGL